MRAASIRTPFKSLTLLTAGRTTVVWRVLGDESEPKVSIGILHYDEYSGVAQILMDRDRKSIPPDEK